MTDPAAPQAGLLFLPAQAQPSAMPEWIGVLPFVAIFFIFYFLVIRPQNRKQREHADLLKGIDKGDAVVTSGGLHGRVTGVTDDVLTLEIANGVRVKVDRARIDRRTEAAKGGDKS
jgi:preprotein translocase subunit YajC